MLKHVIILKKHQVKYAKLSIVPKFKNRIYFILYNRYFLVCFLKNNCVNDCTEEC